MERIHLTTEPMILGRANMYIDEDVGDRPHQVDELTEDKELPKRKVRSRGNT